MTDAAEPAEYGDRADLAPLILAESEALRERQDKRIDDLRTRSISMVTVVSSAVALATALTKNADPAWWSVVGLIAGLILMTAGAVAVHKPKGGFVEGHNVAQLAADQYEKAVPLHVLQRDLATYTYNHYISNEDGPVAWMQGAFTLQLVGAALAVGSVVTSVLSRV
jgi:hypothetical protein